LGKSCTDNVRENARRKWGGEKRFGEAKSVKKKKKKNFGGEKTQESWGVETSNTHKKNGEPPEVSPDRVGALAEGKGQLV